MPTLKRVVAAIAVAIVFLSLSRSLKAQGVNAAGVATAQINPAVRYDFPVRFSLIDDIGYQRTGAKVIRAKGKSPLYLVQIRRDALSTQLVAIAFALIDRAESHYAKHTPESLSLSIPDDAPPVQQAPADRERFELIVAKLRASAKGQVVEVSPGG